MTLTRHLTVLGSTIGILSCGSAGAALQPPPSGAVAPPPSAGHALVYHSALRAVVLVNAGLGGMSSPASSSRAVLWRWDGRSWTVLDSSGPPVRNLGGVAYDSHRDRIVLYGGSYSQDLVYDETWEWSPSSGWTRRDVAGPGRRDHTDMVYDAERRRVVLFGGQSTPGVLASGTWTWDGNAWQEMSASSPAVRVHHTMVYDAVGRRTLLFGGVIAGSESGDTWAWTGTAWEAAAAPTTPRSHARMSMTSDGVILVGGFPAVTSTVARLVGASWSALPTSGGPGARYLTAMVYDPDRQVTVLFGGGDASSNRLYDDTWEYSVATGWRHVAP